VTGSPQIERIPVAEVASMPEPADPTQLRVVVAARVNPGPPLMAASPPEFGVVNLPTWMWIDGPWVPIEDGEAGALLRRTKRMDVRTTRSHAWSRLGRRPR
jgi:hypothetical protein